MIANVARKEENLKLYPKAPLLSSDRTRWSGVHLEYHQQPPHQVPENALGEKAQLYARNNIQEYWVIDVPQTQLWVHHQPQDGQYQSVVQGVTGTIRPLALPEVASKVERSLF